MEVIQIVPYNNQTDVYLDVNVYITFDSQPDPTSLTDKNIILYKLDGITGQVLGAHAVAVNILDEHPEIVEVLPIGNLSPSSRYSMFLNGDPNNTDAYPIGVKNMAGETLNGNYIIQFSTGTEYDEPIENDGEWHNSNEEEAYEDDITATTVADALPSGLQISKTTPYDGQVLSSVNEVIVEFNYGLHEDVNPSGLLVAAECISFPFNVVEFTGSGYFSAYDFNDDRTILTCTVNPNYVNLIDNTIYNLSIKKEYIFTDIPLVDSEGEDIDPIRVYMNNDYSWFYVGRFNPAYADPRQLRGETGTSFDSFPDIVLWYYIHESSKYFDYMTGRHYDDINTIPYEVNRWTVCKSIYDLYALKTGAISTDYRGKIEQKQLGDLMIKYAQGSSGGYGDTGNKWLECITKMWKIIIGPAGSIGVKSGMTSKYRGRYRSKL